MKCDTCKWKYPASFLNAMFINGEYTLPVCGICALEKSNQLTSRPRLYFTGTAAELMRRAAIKWRKEHPADAPEIEVKE